MKLWWFSWKIPTFRCFDKHRRSDNATKFNFGCRSTFAPEQTRRKTQAKQKNRILSHTHPKKGQWNVNSKVSVYRVVKTMHKLYNKNLFNVSLVSMTLSVGFLLHRNPTTKLMVYKMYWMREREPCLGSLIMSYGRKCVSRALSMVKNKNVKFLPHINSEKPQ